MRLLLCQPHTTLVQPRHPKCMSSSRRRCQTLHAQRRVTLTKVHLYSLSLIASVPSTGVPARCTQANRTTVQQSHRGDDQSQTWQSMQVDQGSHLLCCIAEDRPMAAMGRQMLTRQRTLMPFGPAASHTRVSHVGCCRNRPNDTKLHGPDEQAGLSILPCHTTCIALPSSIAAIGTMTALHVDAAL